MMIFHFLYFFKPKGELYGAFVSRYKIKALFQSKRSFLPAGVEPKPLVTK